MTLVPASVAEAQTESKRPNILFIVGDDIGFGDLGISGSVTRTSNLDRLAKRGTFFTNFHASPVCSVSRSTVVTPAYDGTVRPTGRSGAGASSPVSRSPKALRTRRSSRPWSTPPAAETTICGSAYRRR